jgi:hypothetical protein
MACVSVSAKTFRRRLEGCERHRWSRYDGKISLSQNSFRKRAEIDFNFLDLVTLDSQVLGIPKFGAGYPLTFINE